MFRYTCTLYRHVHEIFVLELKEEVAECVFVCERVWAYECARVICAYVVFASTHSHAHQGSHGRTGSHGSAASNNPSYVFVRE